MMASAPVQTIEGWIPRCGPSSRSGAPTRRSPVERQHQGTVAVERPGPGQHPVAGPARTAHRCTRTRAVAAKGRWQLPPGVGGRVVGRGLVLLAGAGRPAPPTHLVAGPHRAVVVEAADPRLRAPATGRSPGRRGPAACRPFTRTDLPPRSPRRRSTPPSSSGMAGARGRGTAATGRTRGRRPSRSARRHPAPTGPLRPISVPVHTDAGYSVAAAGAGGAAPTCPCRVVREADGRRQDLRRTRPHEHLVAGSDPPTPRIAHRRASRRCRATALVHRIESGA